MIFLPPFRAWGLHCIYHKPADPESTLKGRTACCCSTFELRDISSSLKGQYKHKTVRLKLQRMALECKRGMFLFLISFLSTTACPSVWTCCLNCGMLNVFLSFQEIYTLVVNTRCVFFLVALCHIVVFVFFILSVNPNFSMLHFSSTRNQLDCFCKKWIKYFYADGWWSRYCLLLSWTVPLCVWWCLLLITAVLLNSALQ